MATKVEKKKIGTESPLFFFATLSFCSKLFMIYNSKIVNYSVGDFFGGKLQLYHPSLFFKKHATFWTWLCVMWWPKQRERELKQWSLSRREINDPKVCVEISLKKILHLKEPKNPVILLLYWEEKRYKMDYFSFSRKKFRRNKNSLNTWCVIFWAHFFWERG